jgi:hypothetical protein
MATYTLIDSEVLTSSAASVTFSSIPATFTDLVLRMSARGSDASVNNYASLKFNSIASNYSETYLYGSGSTPDSGRFSGQPYWLFGGGWFSSANGTSNTFSNTEIYIPNYAGSTNKVASNFTAQENNTSGSNQLGVEALLLGNTAAITSLTITPSGANFVSGSSFYLYGISNA